MFIGEAPGADEADQGMPFVGPSGRRLNKALAKHGIKRSECYFTNMCKEYIAGNPDPTPRLIKKWAPEFEYELEQVKRRLIITLGKFSLKAFYPNDLISEVHGLARLHPEHGTVVNMYHPAAGIYNVKTQKMIEEDWRCLESRISCIDTTTTEYRIVTSADDLVLPPSGSLVAFDFETTSIDPMTCDLVGMSYSWKPGSAIYVSCAPGGVETAPTSNSAGHILKSLDLLWDGCKLTAHNAKYEMHILSRFGIQTKNPVDCTLMMSYALGRDKLGLKTLALRELGVHMQPIEDLIGKGKKQITMDQVPVEDVGPYACADADITRRLHLRFQNELS